MVENNTPHIVFDVAGPSGERGVMFVAPRNEALEWDLRHEIASTSRYWLDERQAWWVAAPYVPTLRVIAGRFYPSVRETGEASWLAHPVGSAQGEKIPGTGDGSRAGRVLSVVRAGLEWVTRYRRRLPPAPLARKA